MDWKTWVATVVKVNPNWADCWELPGTSRTVFCRDCWSPAQRCLTAIEEKDFEAEVFS